MKRKNWLWYLSIIVIIIPLVFIGCKDSTPTAVDDDESAAFDVVLDAVNNSLANMSSTYSATDLHDLIEADTPPQILSVRSSTHYDLGHIPGAVNVPWEDVYDETELSDAGLNTTDEVVVYCYTGHTAGLATFCLNAMGYNSVNLKFGIVSWTKDSTVRVASPFTEDDCIGAATETTIENYPADNSLPESNYTGTDGEIVQAAVEAYLTSDPSGVIKAQDVYDNLNDGDASDDPFILSVRSSDHYALGHLPGAANIPWRELASDADALKMLPTDRQIVVYCYTGHSAALATAALNLLGYDAVNLKWGIMSWTDDADVRVASPFTEDAWGDYELSTTK